MNICISSRPASLTQPGIEVGSEGGKALSTFIPLALKKLTIVPLHLPALNIVPQSYSMAKSLEYRSGNEDCVHMRHVLYIQCIVTRRDVQFSDIIVL